MALVQDAHINMPFQSWELRPRGVNHAIFTVIAAIVEVEIEIKVRIATLEPTYFSSINMAIASQLGLVLSRVITNFDVSFFIFADCIFDDNSRFFFCGQPCWTLMRTTGSGSGRDSPHMSKTQFIKKERMCRNVPFPCGWRCH